MIATTMSNSMNEKPIWFFMNTPRVIAKSGSAPLSNGADLPQASKLYHCDPFAFK